MSILAIDQGTTGTTSVIVNKQGEIIDKAYQEIKQIYPQPGWVEHDPEEIWQTVVNTVNELGERSSPKIEAIGLTNQRETTVIWNYRTGKPIYNAIVWQCRRTTGICSQLEKHSQLIHQRTGLPCDPYFSGTKIRWILDHCQDQSPEDLLFGTIDTWLIWKLTNGKTHATDYTNAARTLLFNISEKQWDKELCNIIGIPRSILPEVKNSGDHYGKVKTIQSLEGIPICGVAGDQQAALYGQTCFNRGQIKNTYGTGSFVVINTGSSPSFSSQSLITTLAVDKEGGPCFALEGSIFIAGAGLQWLRDELGLIKHAAESEEAAMTIPDNAGVYFVPALVGLGAPWWDAKARGVITGLTRGSNRNHIIRAALEAMAYQTNDVLSVIARETNITPQELFVDGGAVANNFCMQFQADISNITIIRPHIIESTSLGAAFLAGVYSGFWKTSETLIELKKTDRIFKPKMSPQKRKKLVHGWQQALDKTFTKVEE